MKWKIKVKLTIKLMLGSLIAMGVISAIILMWTSVNTIKTLIDNQNRLTEIVLPLDHTTQKVKLATVNLTKRRYSIMTSKTPEELKAYVKRDHLETEFAGGIKELKELSGQTGEVLGGDDIESLVSVYRETLNKDSEFLAAVQDRFSIGGDIESRVKELTAVGSKLQVNAETLSDKISELITKYMSSGGETEKMPEEVTEFFRKDLIDAQKISSGLRLAISDLANYGSQLLLASDNKTVRRITSDKAGRALDTIEIALENLKMGILSNENMTERLDAMSKDFALMRSILIESDNSITTLKSRFIEHEDRIETLNADLNAKSSELDRMLKVILQKSDNVRNSAESSAEAASKNAKWIILAVGLIEILFMLVAGRIIWRRIIHPITKVVAFADTISHGDLTAQIEKDHDDEVGDLVLKLSLMAKNLNTLIGQVQRSGIQITSSATELTATSKQQEAVMKTQVESTNYVVKSIGEISQVSSELVDTMEKVASMSDQTAEFANSGQTDLSQMEAAMHHMENASKSISGKLEAINEKAANITSVVTTITKVADQTDLLSLNAAIEAEKAGESGRGFTVVAREIRRLADQTAVATLDIDQMVKEMQSAVSAGVMEMDAFIAEVQRSAESVGKISKQLTRIIEQVQALSPSFEGVNESMQIQSENAKKINESMVNLSEELQQTVDSLRESFMAIEQLNDAAKGLQDEVSRFKVIV